MKSIAWYLYLMDAFLKEKHPARYALSTTHGLQTFIDQWGIIESAEPIGAKYTATTNLESIQPRDESFEDLFLEATWRGVDNAIKHDKKIKISYSGGTDSLAVFTAIMQHPRYEALRKSGQVEVIMTSTSIKEQPEFFSKFIDGKLKYSPLIYCDFLLADDSIIFTGDYADVTISTSFITPLIKTHGSSALTAPSSLSREFYQSIEPTGKLVSVLDRLTEKCPFKIETALQYAWWTELATSMSYEMFLKTMFSRHTNEIEKLNSPMYCCRPFQDPEIIGLCFKYFSDQTPISEYNDLKAPIRQFSFKHTGIDKILQKRKVPSIRMIPRKVRKYIIFDDSSSITSLEEANKYYAKLA